MTFLYPTTTPAPTLAGKILVVPIVSVANVGQLAVDLLISTLGLKQVAILDPSYCIPAVGAREDGTQGITTPLELFSAPDSKLVVIQQRSPVLVSLKQEYVTALLDFIQTSKFSAVLFLSGMDLSTRTDSQMLTPTYQIQLPHQKSLLPTSPLSSLLTLPIPNYTSPSLSPLSDPQPSSPSSNSDIPFIPGGGLTRRILASLPSDWTIPTGSLLQFVLEGDNAEDAALFAAVTAKVLGLEIPPGGWKQPLSWKAGLFGSPHDQSLYG